MAAGGWRLEHRPQFGKCAGVEPVGLGQPPARLGEAARHHRIDPGEGDASLAQRVAQQPVMAAGCFENDEARLPVERRGKGMKRRRLICDPKQLARLRVEEIDHRL
jgi:hypothetical protein